jgi:hypothetical protein
MTFDLQRIAAAKRAFRQRLAAQPVAEKLRLLDELRERAITLRAATAHPAGETGLLREEPAPYRTDQLPPNP